MSVTETKLQTTNHSAWNGLVSGPGLVVTVYILATLISDADFMGDTVDYVSSIVGMRVGHNYFFWEFAHLLWRPFGYLISLVATPLTSLIIGKDPTANVTLQLLIVSWLLGLLIVVLTHNLIKRLTGKAWVANVVAVATIFSQGFLVHSQSGTAYVPGLAMLLLGLYLMIRYGGEEKLRWVPAALAGAALAISVGFWVTYVLAVPGALVAPFFLFGLDRRRFRFVLIAGLSFSAIILLSYGLVLMHLGIYTLSGFRAWMAASADAAFIPRGGIARTVFSFARSFITMGNDGTLFKRFLYNDPFNPVSLSELLRLSLWKLAFFYVMFAALAISLIRSKQGRQALGLLIVASIPVMALALLLEGGAVDRYLPIFPFFFLALGIALGGEKLKVLKVVMIAFFIAAAIANLAVLSVWTLRKQQEASAARIRELQPQLKPQSLLLTANLRDELVNFNRSFPLHPVNLDTEHPVRVGSVIGPGAENVSHWQRDFSAGVLKAWEKGGDVWVSRRVLSPRPHADWGWVESDDPRVSWKDVYSFFSQLEIGQSVGGEDGFVLIAPTPHNTQLFMDWSRKPTT